MLPPKNVALNNCAMCCIQVMSNKTSRLMKSSKILLQ